jgi:hypothetical protein
VLDHAADGLQAGLPHGFEEVHLELEGGERFAIAQGAGIRHAHGGIGNIAENAAVQRAHGIGVLRASLKRNTRVTGCNRCERKTN